MRASRGEPPPFTESEYIPQRLALKFAVTEPSAILQSAAGRTISPFDSTVILAETLPSPRRARKQQGAEKSAGE